MYESPVLGTGEDFGDSPSRESECKNDRYAIKESKPEKEILGEYKTRRNRDDAAVGEMLHSNGDVKFHCSANNEHKPKSLKEVLPKLSNFPMSFQFFSSSLLFDEMIETDIS